MSELPGSGEVAPLLPCCMAAGCSPGQRNATRLGQVGPFEAIARLSRLIAFAELNRDSGKFGGQVRGRHHRDNGPGIDVRPVIKERSPSEARGRRSLAPAATFRSPFVRRAL